jgi:integrase
MSGSSKIKFNHNKLKGLSTTEEDGRLVKRDTLVNGLLIRVYPSGTKTFFLKKRLKPKHGSEEIVSKIGRFPEVSLSEARTEARELLNQIEKGEDPRKEDIASELSFGDITERFLDDYAEDQLADSTRREYERIIKKHLGKEADNNLSKKAPENISPDDVESLMDSVANNADRSEHAPIEDEYKGNRMANCVRKVINSIYSNTKGLNIESPAKQVPKKPESGERRNPLSDDQIQTLWEKLEHEDPVMENYFKMLLVLGQRRTETARMKWKDLEEDLWKIPPEDTKNSELHVLPLPSLAQQLLEDLEQINGDEKWVFSSPHNRNDGPINGLSKPVKMIRERCDFSKEDFRIHDLRTTVITNLAKIGVKSDVMKRVVNHSVSGVTDKHYDAHKYISEKREALKKWARKLADIVGVDLDSLKKKESQKLEERVQQLEDNLQNLELESDVQDEVDTQLETIHAQLNSAEPSEVIIEECKKKIQRALREEVDDDRAQELVSEA